jgi:hypothetical protein
VDVDPVEVLGLVGAVREGWGVDTGGLVHYMYEMLLSIVEEEYLRSLVLSESCAVRSSFLGHLGHAFVFATCRMNATSAAPVPNFILGLSARLLSLDEWR